jgi:hypothetical protein
VRTPRALAVSLRHLRKPVIDYRQFHPLAVGQDYPHRMTKAHLVQRGADGASSHMEWCRESDHTIRAWFIGMNPQLDDESPIEAVLSGRHKEVLAAARAFLAGG